MSATKIKLLRWLVFNIWFLSLFVIIACFVASAAVSDGAKLEMDYIESATLLFGLITPPLGTMIAFYAAAPQRQRSLAVSDEFFTISLMCSILYHALLISLSIAGVVFLAFDRSLQPGVLYRNCVFIVNWMGLLSVLLGPSVWLFAKPESQTNGVDGKETMYQSGDPEPKLSSPPI